MSDRIAIYDEMSLIFEPESYEDEGKELCYCPDAPLNELDESYVEVLKQFIREYNEAKNESEKIQCLDKFEETYTLIPDLLYMRK